MRPCRDPQAPQPPGHLGPKPVRVQQSSRPGKLPAAGDNGSTGHLPGGTAPPRTTASLLPPPSQVMDSLPGRGMEAGQERTLVLRDRKSTRLNSSHVKTSYA